MRVRVVRRGLTIKLVLEEHAVVRQELLTIEGGKVLLFDACRCHHGRVGLLWEGSSIAILGVRIEI